MTAIVIGEAQSISGVPKREVVPQAVQQVKKESGLQKGASVRVQRSSGAIESGWVVDRFDPSTGDAIVIKSEGGHFLKKQIPSVELERLNRPATTQDIPYAENSQQLTDILNQIGGIQGSQEFYSSGELIKTIKDVMADRVQLERITRTGGLRQKVADLMK